MFDSSTTTGLDFEKLTTLCQSYRLAVRVCTQWHWQILSYTKGPLVNVWPTSGRYGKAVEQHEYTKDITMKSSIGNEQTIIEYALMIQERSEQL